MFDYSSFLSQFTPNISDSGTINNHQNSEVNVVNIPGANIVVAEPGTTTNFSRKQTPMCEPIYLKKRGTPLIIHDKRWYFRLVPPRQEEKYTTRSLMEDYTINDIARHLVVCFTPNTVPDSNGVEIPLRSKDGKYVHIFAFFDSYLEFSNYIIKIPREERSFYEIIFGELPQKIHFDIDISISELITTYPDMKKSQDTIEGFDEYFGDNLRDIVIFSSISVLDDFKVKVNIEKDVLIYTSNSKEKRSYHIVFNNMCHDGNKEARAFYDLVIAKVTKITQGKYLEFIDQSVYGPRQQFRIVGTRKQGSNRQKQFSGRFQYKDDIYTHIYTEDISDENIKKLTIIYESLVSFTSGCNFLPSFIPPEKLNKYYPGNNSLSSSSYDNTPDIDNIIIDNCMNMLREKMSHCPFTVINTVGNTIILKRNGPSYCPLCLREHQNENPYLYIVHGKVYWDCRRNSNKEAKYLIGYTSMTIEEMQSTITKTKNVDSDSDVDDDDGEDVGFMFGGVWIPGPNGEMPKEKLTKLNKESSPPTPPPPRVFPNTNIPMPETNISPQQLLQNIPNHLESMIKTRVRTKENKKADKDITGFSSLHSVLSSSSLDWKPGA